MIVNLAEMQLLQQQHGGHDCYLNVRTCCPACPTNTKVQGSADMPLCPTESAVHCGLGIPHEHHLAAASVCDKGQVVGVNQEAPARHPRWLGPP